MVLWPYANNLFLPASLSSLVSHLVSIGTFVSLSWFSLPGLTMVMTFVVSLVCHHMRSYLAMYRQVFNSNTDQEDEFTPN